ncbi:MAG TPA: PDZ domain-containing protein, partial [Candidatus Dormibacteraeota bacterium]|nr:PDZ domain-containing protein [Candidatus Dormibacteraeota bacterium]
MKYVAFIQPGVGSSDALIDWLEQHEVRVTPRDVTKDESHLAEAIALGGGLMPVLRADDRTVVGFDPEALEDLLVNHGSTVGLVFTSDPSGRVIVKDVLPGSVGEGAGVQSGDVITKLGGYTIFSVDQIRTALEHPRAARVALEVKRGEEIVRLRVQVPF